MSSEALGGPRAVRHVLREAVLLAFVGAVGVLSATQPSQAALVCCAVLVSAAVVRSPEGAPERLLLGAFLVLLVWSYGAANIPLGPLPVPAVDILVLVLATPLLAIRVLRRGESVTGSAFTLAMAGVLVTLLVVRILVDWPQYGLTALRDSVLVYSLLGYPIGAMVGNSLKGRRSPAQALSLMLAIATAWLALYPFRHTLAGVGPIVGIQREVPLLSFVSAPFVGAASFVWFVNRGRTVLAAILAGLGLAVVVMSQYRTMYVAIVITMGVWLVRRVFSRPGRGALARRIAVTIVLVVTAVGIMPIAGRLGEVGVATVVAQVESLRSGTGPGSQSLDNRLHWWSAVINETAERDVSFVIGQGLGPDLAEGFRIKGGVAIRKPHNDVVEVFGRFGLLGLIAWAWILGGMLIRSLRLSAGHQSLRDAVLGLSIVGGAMLLTQPFFSFTYGGMTWLFLLGLATSSDGGRHITSTPPPRTRPA